MVKFGILVTLEGVEGKSQFDRVYAALEEAGVVTVVGKEFPTAYRQLVRLVVTPKE
jgi:hypothetical protein